MKFSNPIDLTECSSFGVCGRTLCQLTVNHCHYYQCQIDNFIIQVQYTANFNRENQKPIAQLFDLQCQNRICLISIRYEYNEEFIIENAVVISEKIIELPEFPKKEIIIGIIKFEDWKFSNHLLNDSSNFNEKIQSSLFKNLSDITLVAISGSLTERINCHSYTLCMKKNFFFKAFESKYAKNKSREVYVFCRKEAILAIIEFIYTGQVDCKVFTKKNYSLILEIYQRAHDYGLTTLKEMIKVFILAYLDESTLSILLGSGILNKEDSFLKKIFNFIPNIINKTI